MSSRRRLKGQQEPRIILEPEAVSSAGKEAVELAEMAGVELDPWQRRVLCGALAERPDGKWAAFEVGVVCPRQNGKNEILTARQLAGLFLLEEELQVHSAHQFDTSLEAFRRLLTLIEDTPDFDRRVKRVSRAHGEEGIELKGGRRIRFRTRTKGGGRGFSSDCLYLDEAMILPEPAHGALLPTLSARSNPQVFYTASAVDQWIHEHGVVLARIRERALGGEDPGLAYFEWSAEGENPQDADCEEQEAWAIANPGLGIRISRQHVEHERRSMDRRTFAVERLGIGDWPRTDGHGPQVISEEAWSECVDARSRAQDPVCFAVDVAPDRSSAAIAVAGARTDGLSHIEVVEHRRGTGWILERVCELVERHETAAVIGDSIGPAATLVETLEKQLSTIEVISVNAKEYGRACGTFFDACDQRSLRHLDTPELSGAVRGAAQRSLGDAWAWSRKNSAVDITPLVAVTLALFGLRRGEKRSVYEDRGLLTV